MSTAAWSSRSIWEKRIERTKVKADDSPSAVELLSFYRRILEFQKAVYERLPPSSPSEQSAGPSLREALDLQFGASSVSALLEVVKRWAPLKLQLEAEVFGGLSPEQIIDRLRRASLKPSAGGTYDDFFARVLLQPLAERFASNSSADDPTVAGAECPCCEGTPQLAVLRQEGDGGKRWLLCSFCQSEWEFHRIRCPNCGERSHEKLPRFTNEDSPAVRVEACDSCQAYLKSFDLTLDGRIVPLVDDIATAPLDIWAVQKGYRKIQPNLLGF